MSLIFFKQACHGLIPVFTTMMFCAATHGEEPQAEFKAPGKEQKAEFQAPVDQKDKDKDTQAEFKAPTNADTNTDKLKSESKAIVNNPDREAPPVLNAHETLPEEFLKNENCTISETVNTDGFFQHYHVESSFGAYDLDSLALLKIRVHEIDVLAKTTGLKGQNEFVISVGEQLKDTGKAAVRTVINPVKTAKAVASGIQSTAQDALDFIKRKKQKESLASRITGQQKRKLAMKFDLDAYSTNPKVQEFLDHLANARTAGSTLVNVTIDASTFLIPVAGIGIAFSAIQSRASVSEAINSLSPTELYRYNDKKLKKMGMHASIRDQFLMFPVLTPRQKTVFTDELEGLDKVSNRTVIVDSILAEQHPQGDVWQEQSMAMLSQYNKKVEELVSAQRCGPAISARTLSGKMLLVLPVDLLYFDVDAATIFGFFDTLLDVAAGTPRECVLSGSTTARAKSELAARGFTIREHFLEEK